MAIGHALSGFTQGLASGAALRQHYDERKNKKALRTGLGELAQAEVAENPDGTFSYLGETFQSRPTMGLQQAARMGQMADLYTQYGDDPATGIEYGNKALEARTKAIESLTQSAILSGDLGRIRDAYRMVNDGNEIDFRELGDGRYEVFNAHSGRTLTSGSQDEIITQLSKSLSPDLYYDLATKEMEFEKTRLGVQKLIMEMTTGMPEERRQQAKLMLDNARENLKRMREGGNEADIARAEQMVAALESSVNEMYGMTGPIRSGAPSGGTVAGVDLASPAAQTVIRIAQEEGVDPAVALSMWVQESNASTDLGLTGEVLPEGHKYASHYARGPWQIMTFHGDIPQTFEGQTRWAMRYLKKNGIGGYYGSSGDQGVTGLPDHPTGNQYIDSVRQRAAQIREGLSTPSDRYARSVVEEREAPKPAKAPGVQDQLDLRQLIQDQSLRLCDEAYGGCETPEQRQEAYRLAHEQVMRELEGIRRGVIDPGAGAPPEENPEAIYRRVLEGG